MTAGSGCLESLEPSNQHGGKRLRPKDREGRRSAQ